MAIRKIKPNTAGRRIMSIDAFDDITKAKPEKRLTFFRKKHSGRNASGRITVRHQGGGARQRIRMVDFKRIKYGQPANVEAIEYDPNRSARLALIKYGDGELSYIVAPLGLKVGEKIVSAKEKIEIKIGNRLPLEHIPTGLIVHAIELQPGQGAKMARSAGVGAQLMAIEGKYAHLKMPSSEIRMVAKECSATIGQVSNPDHQNIRIGKAGRKRHLGIRPTVRGKVMNPVDHPHGGGEGKNPIGLKHPKTPWGKPALGVKTRKFGKKSDKYILQRRKKK
ncbi:MAG: 50S ribosomal protein L2 [bacterium]